LAHLAAASENFSGRKSHRSASGRRFRRSRAVEAITVGQEDAKVLIEIADIEAALKEVGKD